MLNRLFYSTLDKVQHLHWSMKITTYSVDLVVHLVVIYKLGATVAQGLGS